MNQYEQCQHCQQAVYPLNQQQQLNPRLILEQEYRHTKSWFTRSNSVCIAFVLIGILLTLGFYNYIEGSDPYKICSLISYFFWEIGMIVAAFGLHFHKQFCFYIYIISTGISLLIGIIGIIIELTYAKKALDIVYGLISLVATIAIQGKLMAMSFNLSKQVEEFQ